PVAMLDVRNGEVFAGGLFEMISGVPATGIARFDGQQWQPFGEPLFGAGYNPSVTCSLTYNGALVIGGSFQTSPGAMPYSSVGVARWDGTHWTGFGQGVSGGVGALTEYHADLIAAGYFNGHLARWDGTAWQSMGDTDEIIR